MQPKRELRVPINMLGIWTVRDVRDAFLAVGFIRLGRCHTEERMWQPDSGKIPKMLSSIDWELTIFHVGFVVSERRNGLVQRSNRSS